MTDARLLSFIERIERLETEKAAIAADVKEVKAEAKSAGYDLKTINEILRLRKMEEAERQEREAMLDTYKAALGMISDLPLGKSAISRATGERDERGAGKPTGAQETGAESTPHDPETGEIVSDAELAEVCREVVRENLHILDVLMPDPDPEPDRLAASLSGLKNTLAAVG